MVAVRVLRGLGAEDSRSDDEDEDEGSPLEDVPEVHTTTTATRPVENGTESSTGLNKRR
jgi:acyl-CoA-dependent ceramide synthase